MLASNRIFTIHFGNTRKIALPLQHYRTFQEVSALVTLPNGKPTSKRHGPGNGERAQGAPDQDQSEHERPRRFKLPRPGRAPSGGGGRPNPVLGVLGGLGGHSGDFARKGHGGGEEAGWEGSREATGAEAAVMKRANQMRSRRPMRRAEGNGGVIRCSPHVG